MSTRSGAGRPRAGSPSSASTTSGCCAADDLAPLIASLAGSSATSSARNRLSGIVVAVKRDGVMAQVELACGDYRIVSLMSRDAADELGLEVGRPATAVVKATNVIVEVSQP